MTVEDELLFKTIFEQTPVSTQIFTPDGETIMVNSAWEKLWNVPFAKIKKYNILQDKQLVETGVMPYVKRAFRGESVELPTIKYIPSKTVKVEDIAPYRWLGAKMYPIRNTKGKITHLVLQHEDITQSVKAKEMQQRMAAIVESSDDAIVSKNLHGIIQSWNKGAEKLFGYTAREAIGKHISLIIPKDRLHEEDVIIRRIKKGLSIDHYETERMRKDKKHVYVSLSISPVKDGTGKIIGAANITRDISKEMIAEEALRESEELFRILTHHAPVGIFLSDKNGKCLFVNKHWTEIAGISQKAALGDGWANALHPEDREMVFRAWSEATKKGTKFNLEYRFVTPKGKVTWLSGSSIALHDRNKNTTGYLGTITDISYRKSAEEALRISEERLRTALNAGNIGVWDWDIKNNTLTWTENVYRIHGVSPNKFTVSVENFSALIHSDDREWVGEAIRKSVEEHAPFTYIFRIVRPTGEIRWISTSAYISVGSDGKAERMLGATTDVTEQKQLEQEKSDFLSMASHELKTPLTSIKIFLELLDGQLKGVGTEKQRYYLQRIIEQTNRLTELTGDLLDVSRIETGKLRLQKETFILDELIRDTIESIGPSTSSHTINFRKNGDIKIHADRYRLYQVLVNLLTNAIKYSPKGEKISISLKKIADSVQVRVKDHGIGIKREKQKRIFEKLYQVSDPEERTYPGLGLGLYISKEIIDRHHGKIWVESEGKGKGSTFIFTLPVESRN